MNQNTLKAVAKLSLAGLTVCFFATAQEAPRMKANVPFGFEAGPTRLPAGDYSIEQTHNLVIVRNQRTHESAAMLVQPVMRSSKIDEGYLVFHKVGSKYFLSTTWAAGNAYGRALLPSKHEREAANLTASSMVAKVTVPAF